MSCATQFELFKSLNDSKFAVKCDLNSKISQIPTFWKKKTWIFFAIGKFGKFPVEGVSTDIIS